MQKQKNMNKFIKTMAYTMLVLAVACATGCTKPSDDNNQEYPSGGGNNGGNNGGETPSNVPTIEQLIAENVQITVGYEDYNFVPDIECNWGNVFPGKAIKCGVEYGYLREGESDNVLDCRQYLFRSGSVFIDIVLMFYVTNEYEWPFASNCYLAYGTYEYYKDKIQAGGTMTTDDWSLYNQVCGTLNDGEQKAARAMKGRFFVEVDGVQYNYKRFHFETSPNVHAVITN